MALYRVGYRDPSGSDRVEVLSGPSVKWVRAHLEAGGATDVRIEQEETLPTEGRDLAAEAQTSRDTPEVTIETANTAMLKITLFNVCATALAYWWLGRGVVFWGAAVITILFLAFHNLAVLPLALYQRAAAHRIYYRWAQHARIIAVLRLHPIVLIPAMRIALAFEAAKALAGKGRLSEGIALVRAIRGAPATNLASMEATLYAIARDFDAEIEAFTRAVNAPGGAACRFDLARRIVEHTGDAPRARAAIGEVDEDALTELETAFWRWAEAEISIADGRPADALDDVERVAELVTRLTQPPDRGAILLVLDEARCRALAGLGRAEEASAALARCRPLLEARQDVREIERCEAALSRARARS